MIITKLLEKYKIGCGRGVSAIKEKNMSLILNSVIDWENSVILKPDDSEKSTVSDHYLEPGDCFCLGTNKEKSRIVLAMDADDQLVCVLNDTGPYALQRIWEEKVMPEYELMHHRYDKVDVRSWEPKNTATDFPKEDKITEIKVNKNKYRLWKEKFLRNRGNCNFPDAFLELRVISDDTFGMEVPLYLTKYTVYTDKSSMFADMSDFMEDLVSLTLEWLYNEIPEIKPQKQDLDPDEEEQP
jgi:hypothetical protein